MQKIETIENDKKINNPYNLNEEQLENLFKYIWEIKWYFTDTRDWIQNSFNTTKLDEQLQVLSLLEHYSKALNWIIEWWYAWATKFEQSKFKFLKVNEFDFASFWSSKLPKININKHFRPILDSESDTVTIFVKCSIFQVENVLNISTQENLELIKESIKYLKENDKEIIIDMEHFFDWYKENQEYSKKCIEVALENWAKTIVLCDTLWKTSPFKVEQIINELCDEEKSPEIAKNLKWKIWLHLHEDKFYTKESIIKSIATWYVSHIQWNFTYAWERIWNSPLALLFVTLFEDYWIDIFENARNREELWWNMLATYAQIKKLLTWNFPGRIDWLLNTWNSFHSAWMHTWALWKKWDSYSIYSQKILDLLNLSNIPWLNNSAWKENVKYYLEKCFDFEKIDEEDKKKLINWCLELLKKPIAIDYTNSLASFLIIAYLINNNIEDSIQKTINKFLWIWKISTSMEIDEDWNHIKTNVKVELLKENKKHKFEMKEFEKEQKTNWIFHNFISILKDNLKYEYLNDLKLISYSSKAKTKLSNSKVKKRLVFKDNKSEILFSVIVEDNNDDLASINAIKQALYYFILCKESKIKHVPDKVLEVQYQNTEWSEDK